MRAWIDARNWLIATGRRFLPLALTPGPRWPALSPAARTVERVVHLLDNAIQIPGTRLRVGLDPLLGMIFPAVGDTVGGVISLGVLFLAVQYRVPPRVIGRMVVNVAVDTAVGAIPVVGDVVDFGWKANDRNFEMIMRHRSDVPKRTSLGYWLQVGALFLVAIVCVAAPVGLLVWLVVWLRK